MRNFNTEGLKWRAAFRRAGFFVAIWLLSIYVLGTAFPETFPLLEGGGEIFTLLFYGVFFFFFFAIITAFTERSKARRIAQQKAQEKAKPGAGPTRESGETGPGDLKGRHNPNTSRKKATRRRRR